jgi:hypothetical protein
MPKEAKRKKKTLLFFSLEYLFILYINIIISFFLLCLSLFRCPCKHPWMDSHWLIDFLLAYAGLL